MRIAGPDALVHHPEDLLVYECDGFTLEKAIPDAVVHVTATHQVAEIVKLCHRERVPFYARGTGTGLSGGCAATRGGVVIALNRLNRILEIDARNRIAVVEAGVINLAVSQAAALRGCFYAPDPASGQACTIGGNIAENSGGPHCLKYGVTTNHGYDLLGLFIGSEGTLGICTKAVLRLLPLPEGVRTALAVFDSVDDASQAVSHIIAAGIIPVALEMMDKLIIRAVEESIAFGFPLDAEAVLIVEVDGLEVGLDATMARIEGICQANKVREWRRAASEEERLKLWTGRKGAFGAVGRLSPSFCTQDGTVPRSRLPEMLRRIAAIGDRYGLRIANVFHAGDGNLHPLILFDERDEAQVARVRLAARDILTQCVELGGTITGEHGIGTEKIAEMGLVFGETDLRIMRAIKRLFDPDDLCNPGKVLPREAGASTAVAE
jgi:glycolate oxidase